MYGVAGRRTRVGIQKNMRKKQRLFPFFLLPLLLQCARNDNIELFFSSVFPSLSLLAPQSWGRILDMGSITNQVIFLAGLASLLH